MSTACSADAGADPPAATDAATDSARDASVEAGPGPAGDGGADAPADVDHTASCRELFYPDFGYVGACAAEGLVCEVTYHGSGRGEARCCDGAWGVVPIANADSGAEAPHRHGQVIPAACP